MGSGLAFECFGLGLRAWGQVVESFDLMRFCGRPGMENWAELVYGIVSFGCFCIVLCSCEYYFHLNF